MMQKLFASLSLLFLFLIMESETQAQSLKKDRLLIQAQTTEKFHFEEHRHQTGFLLADHPSAFVRYNPFTLLFGSLMWVYQNTITHQLSSTCIYSPTCSSYSINLIREYGLLPGIILTSDRLTRCNRLALYDFPESEVDHHIHRIRQDADYYRLRQ